MFDAIWTATVVAEALSNMQIIDADIIPIFVDKESAVSMIHDFSGTHLRKTICIRNHYLQQSIDNALV